MIYRLRQWWLLRQLDAIQRRRDMAYADFDLALRSLNIEELWTEAKLRGLQSDHIQANLAQVKGTSHV